MSAELKCPICNGLFVNGVCQDTCCELSYVKPKEKIEWKHFWYRFFHTTPRDIYYKLKSRFVRKHYLIDTGLPRWHWIDKDYVIFEGVMITFQKYVEEECLPKYNDDKDGTHAFWGWHEHDIDGEPVPEFMTRLYKDWKVNYPKLCQLENLTLDQWADNKGFHDGGDFLESLNVHTEEFDRLFKKHGDLEQKRLEMEDDMLHRVIKIRSYLWT